MKSRRNLRLVIVLALVWFGSSRSTLGALPGAPPFSTLANDLLRNLTQKFTDHVADNLRFCVVDANKDRDLAFNFQNDLQQFIVKCLNVGSLYNRLCGEAEIRLYFESLGSEKEKTNVTQNSNCNLTNWGKGCDPGWASSVLDVAAVEIPEQIPLRIPNAQPCCEGFFCPAGLSCMIPCPLGAYCKNAVHKTGDCSPYGYHPRPPNGECGGADRWADIHSAPGIFCPAGKFCPSPASQQECGRRKYCREGSTEPSACYKFTSCKAETETPNLQIYGGIFIIILATLLLLIYSCSNQIMSFRERRRSKAREKASMQARELISAVERWRVTSPPTGKLPVPPIAYVAKHGPKAFKAGNANTESQVLRYAFRQIEHEKVTPPTKETEEIIADLPDGRRRQLIELEFRDLTMVLKKSGKKILSNVTGKLSPGNVTAIMGPSGAGKTTFLNAVAGKSASECKTTGHIYINKRLGSMRSYRKIIGFVPQDDIVHGSLTVEENLVFSSKYRLSVDLPKQERVLVVERIIASLGLGPIRESVVGTVEKRGISGGQRKRVNVGMEMVMEPSLLILDEPTSGLDSTSSRLVLQALRREAMIGVNVVVVLHQPSYGLFRMFDSVMFFAKGGRTVYLGPVATVENYFESLGVTVPERINPPDYYMDVLEGIIKREGSSDFDPSVLPIIWMQHEGHKIPDDLKEMASAVESSYNNIQRKKVVDKSKTFRQEAWEELKAPIVVWWDGIRHAVFTDPDESGRKTPGFFSQFFLILKRLSKQRFREARLIAQDYIILFLAGICVGLLSDVKDRSLGANGYAYSTIALSLLCMIAGLRTFTSDKLQFWRESASGINRVAFFLAKDTVDHFNTVIKPLVFLSMFYFFNNPRSTFVSNYVITLAFLYCVTGISYIFAILLEGSTAQLSCVFFPVVSTLIATKRDATGFLYVLQQMSYARWALEAYVVANAERYYGVWLITRCGVLKALNYDLHNYNLCIIVLVVYGLGARAVALMSLFFSNRRKQR